MTYLASYRRWRPQTFAEVIGQEHVVAPLSHAVESGQVHHALLFTGTRGTGKTSVARILAKALDCERGPSAEPCNDCATCRAITDGSCLDVVEIDAASHGSVEDARELREKASYAPVSTRYKVYIVDEAHMVTTQGFNAMLKVLEEPPEHVRFVFATTEPQKVIEPIRSRCQRYDFRRVAVPMLATHLRAVCAGDGLTVDDAALELVARAGDGSVRDALSRLDQVTAIGVERVTLADAVRVLGAAPAELCFDVVDAVAGNDAAAVLKAVEMVSAGGLDPRQFTQDVLAHVRNLLVLRVAPGEASLLDMGPETAERLAVQADRFGSAELVRLITILSSLASELRLASEPRLLLEAALVGAAWPTLALDASSLLARIERLERRLGAAGAVPTALQSTTTAPAGLAGSHGVESALAVSDPPLRPPADPPARDVASSSMATAQSAPGDSPALASDSPNAALLDDAPPGNAPPDSPSLRQAEETAPDAFGSSAEPASVGRLQPGSELDMVRRSWSVLVEHVQHRSRVSANFLELARPVRVEGRQLVVEFSAADRYYAEALRERAAHVESALEELFGGGLRLGVEIGEGGAPAGQRPESSSSTPAGQGRRTQGAAGATSRGSRSGAAQANEVQTGSAGAAAPSNGVGAGHGGEADASMGMRSTSGAHPDHDVDPDNDPSKQLGPDADARAMANLAVRLLDGQVIEERPTERGSS